MIRLNLFKLEGYANNWFLGLLLVSLSLSNTLQLMFLSTFDLDETAFELIYYKWPRTLWTIAIESVNTRI